MVSDITNRMLNQVSSNMTASGKRYSLPEGAVQAPEPQPVEIKTGVDSNKIREAINKMKENQERDSYVFGKKIVCNVDQRTNRMQFRIIDRTTNEILKEMPSKELLDILANIKEFVGVLVDETA